MAVALVAGQLAHWLPTGNRQPLWICQVEERWTHYAFHLVERVLAMDDQREQQLIQCL